MPIYIFQFFLNVLCDCVYKIVYNTNVYILISFIYHDAGEINEVVILDIWVTGPLH